MQETLVQSSTDGRDRLDRLIRALRAKKTPTAASIPRRGLDAGAPPLTPAQERLYLLHQLAPDAATYTLAGSLHLAGALDVGALHHALNAVIERHAPLRTTFAPAANRDLLVQHIAPPGALAPLPIVDLEQAGDSGVSAAETLARQPFDLACGPLLRATLIRLGPLDHRLVLALHHLVADGWSLGILVHELAHGYRRSTASSSTSAAPATAERAAQDLAPLAIDFGDYATWLRSRLDNREMREAIERSSTRLAGVPVLELPTDRPRPAIARYAGAQMASQLDRPLIAKLEDLAHSEDATLFMALLAAFGALLGRLSRQRDLAIGSPSAGRGRRELEDLVGFFVNTLALRIDLEGQPSFKDLIARAKDAVLAAERDQDVPFEIVVSRLRAARDAAVSPLFQAMLTLEREALPSEQAGTLRIEPAAIDLGISKLDLTLSVTARGPHAGAHWVFKTDLFEPQTIRRFDRALLTLLRAALKAPTMSVDRLPLVGGQARTRLLCDWSRDVQSQEPPSTIHALVEAQAARTPDAVCLELDGATLCYAALLARARAMASRLSARGVGPETIIGICMRRSFALVEALLGVLEVGGAYLPLDPAVPTLRLALMLEDAQVQAVIVDPELAHAPVGEVLAGSGQRHLLLCPEPDAGEQGRDVSRDADAQPASIAVSPANPAYVIYTSGSTGRPKGVVVSHAAAANRLRWVRSADLDARVRFLHKTSIGFDVSVAEIFAPLVAGGRVVLARPGSQGDTAYLVRRIAEAEVTDTSFPPSLLRLLLDDREFAACTHLHTVITGGETVPPDLPPAFYRLFPQTALENRYGPTEATVSVTRWICPRAGEPGPVPIGRPIAGAEVYVLDPELEPVPAGVAGELFLGGTSLARGYLGRPARTAQTFLPHPWSTRAGARLYRTGDLARWRPDGTLVFAGRIDQQVKIRGYRVELGEIETVLRQHPGIREAAVVDLPDGDSRRLAAYVVPADEAQFTASDLESWLGEQLPDHMIPSAFVVLDALPTNAAGKLDRAALPAPQWQTRAACYTSPATATERTVAQVWKPLLAVERVGRDDDFFALGGHSLLATRLVSRLRDALAREVPLAQVFETPTLKGLAAALDAQRPAQAAPPIAPQAAGDPPVLSFAQERMWVLDQLAPNTAAYNLATKIEIEGPLEVPRLAVALGAVSARHAALRTRFVIDRERPADSGPRPVVDAPAPVALRLVDLCQLATPETASTVATIARTEARQPFDLARGPLLRLLLVRAAPDRHHLVVVLHHIVADGWSVPILLRDLDRAYRRDEAPLPALAIQYHDFAAWQRRYLDDQALSAEIDHWRQRLGAVTPLVLPTDRARPAMQSIRGASCAIQVPPATVQALEALARSQDATLFMALLAAFQAVLGLWSGQDDFAVGSPVANRTRSELEPLVGCFINTLALRADLAGTPSFRDLIGRTRDIAIDAFAHQDVPFERLVEALVEVRDPSLPPLVQTLFTLQNVELAKRRIGDLPLTARSIDTGTAKLDLALTLHPAGQGLAGTLEHNLDLFDSATIEAFARRLIVFLDHALAEPDRAICKLLLLAPGEREGLAHWASSGETWRDARDIVTEVRLLAEQAPDRAAVVTPSQTLTYGELQQKARRLTGKLREICP